MYKVTTTDGALVRAGKSEEGSTRGLERKVAEADAAMRNKKAEEFGIKTRYEVRPL